MKLRSPSFALSFITIMTFILFACGSGTVTVTVSPENESAISGAEVIVLTFSDSMDPDSLELGGMAEQSDGGAWSTTDKDNDTLTLTPNPAWDPSQGGTITVNVSTAGGKAIDSVNLTYTFTISFSTFQKADVVFGQENFTTDSSGTSATEIDAPYGNAGFGGGFFYFPDYSNARTLILNSMPTENGASANHVIGQPDLTTNTAGSGAKDELNGPQTVQVYRGKLFQLDYSDNRLLIFNTPPTTTNGASANVVVGQTAFGETDSDCNSKHMDGPESFIVAGDKIFVADSSHNRVLIFNTIPTENGASADVVLGQADFSHCEINDDNQDGADDGSPTSRTFSYPSGIWSNGTILIVADSDNNRVLIWNSIPTDNFERADVVLGQNDFTHFEANDDDQNGAEDAQASKRTLNYPYDGLDSNGTQLVVGDDSNHRVMIWNSIPTENFTPADVVLGQSDFHNSTANDDNQDGMDDGQPSDRTFNSPDGLKLIGNQLVVSDEGNNRYLIFNGQ